MMKDKLLDSLVERVSRLEEENQRLRDARRQMWCLVGAAAVVLLAVVSLGADHIRKPHIPCWRSGIWRCGSSVVTEQAVPLAITWTLAIACACLTIGGAGLSEPIPSVEVLQFSGKTGALAATDDADESDDSMVEMTAPPES